MSTKRDRQKVVATKVESERERILKSMKDADIYDSTLDPLIETYIDTFEVYETMHMEWKDKGFPATQRHTNKAGATNTGKHPLAQLVETWSDKKLKALDMLGLSNKGIKNDRGKNSAERGILTKPKAEVDELAAHRNKWRKKA